MPLQQMSEHIANGDSEHHSENEKSDTIEAASIINVDEEDTDTGDSEFEPPTGVQDDDSIAADEDIADEEEVNGLMRVS